MKIQYCSDLHMEFYDNMRFMKSLPLEVVGDVLVIAGDVGYLVDTTIPHLRFWKWASENYRQVLMVAGNHEYYNNGAYCSARRELAKDALAQCRLLPQ